MEALILQIIEFATGVVVMATLVGLIALGWAFRERPNTRKERGPW